MTRTNTILASAFALAGLLIVVACGSGSSASDLPGTSIPDASRDAFIADAGDGTSAPPPPGVDGGDAPDAAAFADAGRFGFSIHFQSQSDPDAYLALAAAAGATVVRDDLHWGEVETAKGTFTWNAPDDEVKRAALHGLHLLLIVDTAPAWASGVASSPWSPPTNASDYGDFARAVAERYGAHGAFWAANPDIPKLLPAGIEIWNEPNLAIFWAPRPDPVKFTAMLLDAYAKVKAVAPEMTVISGGLAAVGAYHDAYCVGFGGGVRMDGSINQLEYLEAMYANGAAGAFDALGVHPYNLWAWSAVGGWNAAAMLQFDRCSAWSQMNETTPSVRSLMSANGDSAKTIWATELGAPTCIAGGSFVCLVESEQAELATKEVAAWKTYPWAGGYFWYDLRDDGAGASTSDQEEHFGAVRRNSEPKPSYAALSAAWK